MRKFVKETWITSGEIDVKRMYLPGVIVERECPTCRDTCQADLGGDRYLNFPKMNEEFKLGIYCEKCDNEFYVQAQLRVKLEVYE